MTVTLRAGFGRAAITPQLGSPMAGYLARVKGAQGVHDQLSAHAAVFGQGPLLAAVLNLDRSAGKSAGEPRAPWGFPEIIS